MLGFQLFVHSTNVDRTLVSAQSVIASLYPTSAEERAITGLAHQLVPIHTENEETDPVSDTMALMVYFM